MIEKIALPLNIEMSPDASSTPPPIRSDSSAAADERMKMVRHHQHDPQTTARPRKTPRSSASSCYIRRAFDSLPRLAVDRNEENRRIGIDQNGTSQATFSCLGAALGRHRTDPSRRHLQFGSLHRGHHSHGSAVTRCAHALVSSVFDYLTFSSTFSPPEWLPETSLVQAARPDVLVTAWRAAAREQVRVNGFTAKAEHASNVGSPGGTRPRLCASHRRNASIG
jgi:hypothetical protein